MTPQEPLKHLKDEGDSTHIEISFYLEKLNTFSQGHARQNPSVYSKKKSHSEEEEKEEEEEEEEETATALDSNEVSFEIFDMDACVYSKQGLESEIAPWTQNDPELEAIDGCDPSKSALDKNEVSHENFDMDANDQSKQGPEPEVDTENQNRPESEVTDGGDTSINVPGDNIWTDVISPGEDGSDDKSDGSTVLPSNPPSSEKALMHQQYLESKQKQEEEKKNNSKKKQGKNWKIPSYRGP
jgi:hypothetical protein